MILYLIEDVLCVTCGLNIQHINHHCLYMILMVLLLQMAIYDVICFLLSYQHTKTLIIVNELFYANNNQNDKVVQC